MLLQPDLQDYLLCIVSISLSHQHFKHTHINTAPYIILQRAVFSLGTTEEFLYVAEKPGESQIS